MGFPVLVLLAPEVVNGRLLGENFDLAVNTLELVGAFAPRQTVEDFLDRGDLQAALARDSVSKVAESPGAATWSVGRNSGAGSLAVTALEIFRKFHLAHCFTRPTSSRTRPGIKGAANGGFGHGVEVHLH